MLFWLIHSKLVIQKQPCGKQGPGHWHWHECQCDAMSTAVDILICTSIEDIQAAISLHVELQRLKPYIIQDWPHTKNGAEHSIWRYWSVKHELAMIHGIVTNNKWIIIPFVLQNRTELELLHSNYIGIEKTGLLMKELVYLVNMNINIKNTKKQCTQCL